MNTGSVNKKFIQIDFLHLSVEKILGKGIFFYVSTSLLLLAFFVFNYTFLLPIFETNDDISYMMLSSGYYTGTPEFRLIFANSIFGWIVSSLFTISQRINWYSAFLILGQYFSLLFIIWVSLKKAPNIKTVALLLGLILGPVWFSLFYINFTTTAVLFSVSGLIILLNTKRKWATVGGIIMLVFGMLIRLESFAALVIIAAPVILYTYGLQGTWILIKKSMIVFVFAIAFYGINQLTFQDSNWKSYLELAPYKAIVDSRGFDKLKFNDVDLKSAGWSRNDFDMMSSFFFEDSSIVNKTSLIKLSAIPKVSKVPFLSAGSTNGREITEAWFSRFPNALHLMVIGSLFLAFWRRKIPGLILLVISGALLFYFIMTFNPRPRGLIMIYIIVSALCLNFSINQQEDKSGFTNGLMLLLMLFSLRNAHQVILGVSESNTARRLQWKEEVSYMEQNKTHIIVWLGAASKINYQNPLLNYWKPMDENIPKVYWMANLGGSPHQQRAKERLGYQNIFQFFPDSSTCRVITTDENYPRRISNYMEEHYSQKWEFERDNTAPHYMFVWKFFRKLN